MSERYEQCDHTADAMVICRGKNLEECFENAAYAMFDQEVDASAVEPKQEYSFGITAADDEARLYAFLSELLFKMDCDGLVFSMFRVRFQGDHVYCTAKGEPLDLKKHHPKGEVKAVTYHMLKVDRSAPSVTVIFDM
jgi:SHS2 domain-containing protein